ncbi:PREDICTED: TMV resistance protein N-like [Fragaria vesca subsp. vesca]
MGGIGKTTLVDLVFHRLSSQFKASCFLANIREASGTGEGLYDLRNKLLRNLLGDRSISIQTPTIDFFVKAKLCRTKVLVVLDDVNDSSQLEFLAGSKVPFGPGSRIIITTRDLQQLRLMKVLREEDDHDIEIYKVEELNDDEAQQLFVLNAPKDIFSAPASSEFVRRAVDYAAGIPLALKLWRSLFHRRLWNEMKMSLDEKLKSVYRVSYNVLEKNEREIFLDITCFYKGEDIGFVKNQLDACGLSADCGIEVLVDMSLVTIKDNRLWVHDVIQEMGWEIVREQCPEEPGRRTRLCTSEDICHVLRTKYGNCNSSEHIPQGG